MAGKLVSEASLKALSEFASCDVGDALVKLQYPFGGFLDGISMFSPERQAGEAKIFGELITVKMVDASDTSSPSLSKHYSDYSEPGKVIFVSQPKNHYSACWGGLLSTRAKYLGAVGTVIDGRLRDINEHRSLEYPVFARGTSILGSAGFTRGSEINVPVQYNGDLWVHPGDYIIGDADGVVVIPVNLVSKVIELCEARKKIDDLTFEALRNGESLSQAIKRFRK
ncbi:ribonuclease E inhibitor RraA/Dimethylmenaquinone methyltransferase [Lipomyces japonicus]|uniref:ribonuclease E inhibitor RraA/Dimethylmenaquinone methyltransferase n=1 Tax=Lipomyces japonicus TaxID=56871 RepID=UPI0034CD116E